MKLQIFKIFIVYRENAMMPNRSVPCPHILMIFVFVVCGWLFTGQKTFAQNSTPWPTKQWSRAEPGKYGLDGKRLQALIKKIDDGSIKNIHSLLIVRNGYLLVEEYFADHEADELHTLQSVSKSFTSALVGIAIEKKKFSGVDEKVLDFFPDRKTPEDDDPRRKDMTLEDLLTMRSGTDYHERGNDSPHFQLNRLKQGWTEFILKRPMVKDPGTHFQYDSGAVILTSALIHQRYGVHADKFAEEHLFKPLGIVKSRWYRNDEGHPHTGGGLDLRSRDMAKFGLLYLRDGAWDGRQVVPKKWVKASLSRHVEFKKPRGHEQGYGYWWWVLSPDPNNKSKQDIYAALGFMGQHIFLIPERDMVVVVTAGTRGAETRAIMKFFYDEILPSVVDRP